ncbi:WD repeat-containing protein 73 isoform X2 [Narcine bancroftii]|uniref:WD repeat-containing protein 73 isoform X2 n=1 Tax=Narcine bancroftii TaxID=1343680 RepID=UPI0038317694
MAELGESEWDSWMVESLRRYNDLHVFELQDPTRVIEWIQDRSVCVAGYSAKQRNEIQELSLPQTLSAKENQGLCPDRDFRVERGEFSQRPVYQLKYVAGTSLLVSSGPPDASLQVWRLATNETGVEEHEPISELEFLDNSTFLVCCMNGQLWLADTRQRPSLIGRSSLPTNNSSDSHWTMGLGPGFSVVGRLSSDGVVVVSDPRDLSKSLARAELATSKPQANSSHLCLNWAPRLQQHLAVSGFDGTVHVYDSSTWTPSLRRVEPTFVHRGHCVGLEPCQDLPLVTTHTWHPWKQRMLLSAAGDGSLHVWDWVGNNRA